MTPIIMKLFEIFAPIVASIIAKRMAANGGTFPTPEEIQAEFEGNIDKYLSEGAAWLAAHPR